MLYFENLSGAKEDEYFRDGMTEDVITELSKIQGLRVFLRAAVLAYRDKAVTGPQVGHALRASHVLTGSLRRAGNRLRITAQLVDTTTGHSVWAERYDRELQDVFEVQDEIARSITQALRITLTPQDEKAIAVKPTENPKAYDYFLRARSHGRRETRTDLDFALQLYEQPSFSIPPLHWRMPAPRMRRPFRTRTVPHPHRPLARYCSMVVLPYAQADVFAR
jgi:TolB-like protein